MVISSAYMALPNLASLSNSVANLLMVTLKRSGESGEPWGVPLFGSVKGSDLVDPIPMVALRLHRKLFAYCYIRSPQATDSRPCSTAS